MFVKKVKFDRYFIIYFFLISSNNIYVVQLYKLSINIVNIVVIKNIGNSVKIKKIFYLMIVYIIDGKLMLMLDLYVFCMIFLIVFRNVLN